MTQESIHAKESRTGLLLLILCLAAGAYALPQSLVVPALPTLQHDLHASPTGVAWVFTAYLLAASVITPIAGRLGDMFGKKRVFVIALAGLAVGSLVSGLASSLPLMLVGRTIQGLGGAVFPLAFGIIRDEFPRGKVASGIALISGILGIGAGLGILLAGPILQSMDYHWLFWIPLIVTMIAIAAALVVVPSSTSRAPGTVDWLGALLLSAWLVCLLVAVSEAPAWGWGSGRTLGLLAGAAVLLAVWVRAEDRCEHPLVDMKMMRLRGVSTTNAAALLLGFGMYSSFVMVPQFVQTTKASGYGFGASTTQSGLFLLPQTMGLLIFSPLGGRLGAAVGSRVPLVLGSIITGIAFVFLALEHSQRWQVYFTTSLLGVGVGFAFASMANLIVEAVPPGQTGVATGMNTIMRTIGGAIGAEIAATIIAANLIAGGDYPRERAYTIVFALCAAVVGLGLLASLAVPKRHAHLRAAAGIEPQPAPD